MTRPPKPSSPFTRLKRTIPPAFLIRAFSAAVVGLWSQVANAGNAVRRQTTCEGGAAPNGDVWVGRWVGGEKERAESVGG